MRAFSEVVDGEMDFRELSTGYGLWVGRARERENEREAMGQDLSRDEVYETTDEKVLAIRIK